MPSTTKEWIIQTVHNLPEKDAEQVKVYLEFLLWKSELQKTGKQPIAQKIVEAMKKPPHLTEDDIQALLQAIDEEKPQLVVA